MADKFGTTATMKLGIANMANERDRHCRIGKVTEKSKRTIGNSDSISLPPIAQRLAAIAADNRGAYRQALAVFRGGFAGPR